MTGGATCSILLRIFHLPGMGQKVISTKSGVYVYAIGIVIRTLKDKEYHADWRSNTGPIEN